MYRPSSIDRWTDDAPSMPMDGTRRLSLAYVFAGMVEDIYGSIMLRHCCALWVLVTVLQKHAGRVRRVKVATELESRREKPECCLDSWVELAVRGIKRLEKEQAETAGIKERHRLMTCL